MKAHFNYNFPKKFKRIYFTIRKKDLLKVLTKRIKYMFRYSRKHIEGEKIDYQFVSLTGQELLKGTSTATKALIDIRHFSSGTYIVNVRVGERLERWKIIKQE